MYLLEGCHYIVVIVYVQYIGNLSFPLCLKRPLGNLLGPVIYGTYVLVTFTKIVSGQKSKSFLIHDLLQVLVFSVCLGGKGICLYVIFIDGVSARKRLFFKNRDFLLLQRL